MVGEIRIKPNAIQKFIHRFLMLRPVSAFLAKVLHHADAFMLRLTRDRHSVAELVGLPIVQLTTVGAKTGIRRVVPLVGVLDRETIALIASSFGRKHNPGWYYNLKAHPECSVYFNGRSGTYIARETEGDERDHYWQIALSYYAGYEKYETRAAPRRIPVIVLEPKK
ncbi:MAG: nitroreductase family deazaflavin-dependent oxidoreductase [Anaerolineales bacterium]|nr:nitroreductase family deazaflavin-dependent oxidoreductase [Anaerolineae bacterium]PWB70412.1 MAG: nitroreductase family deazaflavin-dependent oxidoreductase [Anaerolineales bacterium]